MIWLTWARFWSLSLFSPVRSAQRVAFQSGGAHGGPAGSGGGLGIDPIQGPVDPLHDVKRVITDRGLGRMGAGGAGVGLKTSMLTTSMPEVIESSWDW